MDMICRIKGMTVFPNQGMERHGTGIKRLHKLRVRESKEQTLKESRTKWHQTFQKQLKYIAGRGEQQLLNFKRKMNFKLEFYTQLNYQTSVKIKNVQVYI